MQLNLLTLSFLFLLYSLSGGVIAEYVQTDRYTLIVPEPDAEEWDPLSVNIQMQFPPAVITVKDAISFVLAPSGYVLADHSESDSVLSMVLTRPLPQVHRELSLMPVRSALQVLMGRYFVPVEDPIRRLYSFDLHQDYRGLVDHD